MRVRHGATPAEIDSTLTSVAAQLEHELPVFNTDRIFVSTPLIDALVGDLKPTLLITFRVVAGDSPAADGQLIAVAGVLGGV